MHRSCLLVPLVVPLLATLACAQATQQPASAPADAQTQSSAVTAKTVPPVNPNDPVIVMDGFCPGTTLQGDACKTVVTRAQFDKLAEALQPGMPVPTRLKVAYTYTRILRMAAAAEQRGLDKTPAFEEEMRFARMQLLSQDLSRALQQDADNITGADLEDYYRKHLASYEQATFARIFVPTARQTALAHQDHQTSASPTQQASNPKSDANIAAADEAMAQLASQLRARAVAGEDPDKLQLEAYSAVGMTDRDPKTRMEKVRRENLPPSHEKVMDLKPGEVSEVIADPGGARFIYKMISKQNLTLDSVEKEIRDEISTQRYKGSMKKFLGDAAYSDAYFNPPSESTQPHGLHAGRRTQSSPPPSEVHNDTESPQ